MRLTLAEFKEILSEYPDETTVFIDEVRFTEEIFHIMLDEDGRWKVVEPYKEKVLRFYDRYGD